MNKIYQNQLITSEDEHVILNPSQLLKDCALLPSNC